MFLFVTIKNVHSNFCLFVICLKTNSLHDILEFNNVTWSLALKIKVLFHCTSQL